MTRPRSQSNSPGRPVSGAEGEYEHAKGEVKFRVVDSVKRLSDNDWQRIVAVFAQGHTWQVRTRGRHRCEWNRKLWARMHSMTLDHPV